MEKQITLTLPLEGGLLSILNNHQEITVSKKHDLGTIRPNEYVFNQDGTLRNLYKKGDLLMIGDQCECLRDPEIKIAIDHDNKRIFYNFSTYKHPDMPMVPKDVTWNVQEAYKLAKEIFEARPKWIILPTDIGNDLRQVSQHFGEEHNDYAVRGYNQRLEIPDDLRELVF